MFKFLLPLAAMGMAIQPVAAEARDHRGDRYHQYDRRDNGKDAGLLIGGVILGAIIASSVDNNRDRDYNDRRYNDRYYDRYDRRNQRCYKERVRDRRGDIYVRQICYR